MSDGKRAMPPACIWRAVPDALCPGPEVLMLSGSSHFVALAWAFVLPAPVLNRQFSRSSKPCTLLSSVETCQSPG